MLAMSSIRHGAASGLAGYVALYLGYRVVFLFYFISHYFRALVSLPAPNHVYFLCTDAYLMGIDEGGPARVPGMGIRSGGTAGM
jgi:hypothetical protein